MKSTKPSHHLGHFQGKRTKYNWVPVAQGSVGERRESVGEETFTFRADVDHEKLIYLAARAASNKSGTAVAGPLTITITKRDAPSSPTQG